MDQMRGDNKRNQQVSSKQLSRNKNVFLSKQVGKFLGDTLMVLIIGMLSLVLLSGVVGAIWNLIA
jgi:hypothetical protein